MIRPCQMGNKTLASLCAAPHFRLWQPCYPLIVSGVGYRAGDHKLSGLSLETNVKCNEKVGVTTWLMRCC